MNIYIKNAIFAIAGIITAVICIMVKAIPENIAGYVLIIAVLFICKGIGKIINEFSINLYKKKTKKYSDELRDSKVLDKSRSVTLLVDICSLIVVAMKPDWIGNPTFPVILICAILGWYILNIALFIYYDKNYVLDSSVLKK